MATPIVVPLFKGQTDFHFAKMFTSSDFMVTGIVILIGGNVELHCGYVAPDDKRAASAVKGASLLAGLVGAVGYALRFNGEEEAISRKVDLAAPTSLVITCSVAVASMILLAVFAALIPSVPPSALE
ncbi:hypothetical protein [Streptomyces echinatus]|uniref:hypothetical protein n=1 Tax=Streptomyces echinatus TaxID=67293 RepID=UPI0038024C15